MQSSFPDKNYLKSLLAKDLERAKKHSLEDQVMAYSGLFLNSVGFYITSDKVKWQQQEVLIDSLTLTGTNKVFNPITLERAEKNPAKLRQIMRDDKTVHNLFKDIPLSDDPILVIKIDSELRVFDGMHRLLAAIR